MYCPKCGTLLDDNAVICGHCRNKIHKRSDLNKSETILSSLSGINTKNQSPKPNNKHNIVIFCLIIIIFISILFFLTILKLSNSKAADQGNIGEVYFMQTESEHIADMDNGLHYSDNEILVVIDEAVSFKDVKKIADTYDAEIVGWIEQTGDYQLKLSTRQSYQQLERICELLKQEPSVINAYPNYLFSYSDSKIDGVGDYHYGSKWSKDLKNSSDNKGKSWGFEAIRAKNAWIVLDTIKERVSPVRIGIIDSGFDTDHEDLGFAETFYNTDASDHGTHVAGTMASKTDNTNGICGVYPYGDGNLYGVSMQGTSTYKENESFLKSAMFLKIAFGELILRNVKVINTSLGFNYHLPDNWNGEALEFNSDRYNAFIKEIDSKSYILGDFLNRLITRGYDFVIVSAAGNDSSRNPEEGNQVIYDSKYSSWMNAIPDKTDNGEDKYKEVYDRIVVVGAVNKNLNICDFSNGGDRVDIYAPGFEIYSTTCNDGYQNTFTGADGITHVWAGTSMAAPHVSGVAAMMWSANNKLTGKEIKEIICNPKHRNAECTSCQMIDAFYCVAEAAVTQKETEIEDVDNGAVLGWIVSSEDENKGISEASVSMKNIENNEEIIEKTDSSGHFEVLLEEGDYTISFSSEGYDTYFWPEIIHIERRKIKYLDDWVKLHVAANINRNNVNAGTSESQIENNITYDVLNMSAPEAASYLGLNTRGHYGRRGRNVKFSVNEFSYIEHTETVLTCESEKEDLQGMWSIEIRDDAVTLLGLKMGMTQENAENLMEQANWTKADETYHECYYEYETEDMSEDELESDRSMLTLEYSPSETNNSLLVLGGSIRITIRTKTGTVSGIRFHHGPLDSISRGLIQPFLGDGWCSGMKVGVGQNGEPIPYFTANINVDSIEKYYTDGESTTVSIESIEQDGEGVILKLSNGTALYAPTQNSDTLWLFSDWERREDNMSGTDSITRNDTYVNSTPKKIEPNQKYKNLSFYIPESWKTEESSDSIIYYKDNNNIIKILVAENHLASDPVTFLETMERVYTTWYEWCGANCEKIYLPADTGNIEALRVNIPEKVSTGEVEAYCNPLIVFLNSRTEFTTIYLMYSEETEEFNQITEDFIQSLTITNRY